MELPAHTQHVEKIRAMHQPTGVRLTHTGRFAWFRNLRRRSVCLVCRQPWPCRQWEWADNIEAGRPAGRRP